MSAANLSAAPPQQRALSAQGYRQHSRAASSPGPRSASHPHPTAQSYPTRQQAKSPIAQNAEVVGLHGTSPSSDDKQNGRDSELGYPSEQLKMADFELMKTLGTGTFARVWLCRFHHPRSEYQGKVFALKVLKKVDVIKLKQVEHVRNERNVLAAVAGHPFITSLLASFADEASLYMLLEYTPGGEIFSYLRRARRFPLLTVQFYAAEITLILSYLHEIQHVAYRDLKPENILLDAEGHLKLVDFGFAKYLPPAPEGLLPPVATLYSNDDSPESNALSRSTSRPAQGPYDPHGAGITYTLCGTPEYLAPEVIRNSGHGTAVDWWALGILTYEMLIGQPPFWDQNPLRIYEQIVAGHIRFPTNHSASDPSQRLGHIAGGSQRVMSHWFFEVTYEMLIGQPPFWDQNPLRIYEQIVAGHIRFPTNHSASGRGGSFYVSRAAREFILSLCKTDPSQRLGHIAGGSQRVMSHWFFEGINWDDMYNKRRRGPILPRVEWEGDAGNFDEYPDPVEGEESEGGRGNYTSSLRDVWEDAFKDF